MRTGVMCPQDILPVTDTDTARRHYNDYYNNIDAMMVSVFTFVNDG